jgi:Rho-binding antiterminator
MDAYTPISCDLHDHVEIACLYRYRVRVLTDDARIVTGTAVNTATDNKKREWLILDDAGRQSRLRLDRIISLEATTPGARFAKIQFH